MLDARSEERLRAAAVRRPGRLDLREDRLTERVARMRERERDVCVKALQVCRIAGAADPELERFPAVGADSAVGESTPQASLLLRRARERSRERRIPGRDAAPALD